MEQVKISPRYYEERMHYFYCDGCSKYLGESHEYNNGWYEKIGKFELNIYLDGIDMDGNYIFNKCLCEICKHKTMLEIEENLRRLGFKNENAESEYKRLIEEKVL